jgi:hypothetical protein
LKRTGNELLDYRDGKHSNIAERTQYAGGTLQPYSPTQGGEKRRGKPVICSVRLILFFETRLLLPVFNLQITPQKRINRKIGRKFGKILIKILLVKKQSVILRLENSKKIRI